jgi:hypothetical protein
MTGKRGLWRRVRHRPAWRMEPSSPAPCHVRGMPRRADFRVVDSRTGRHLEIGCVARLVPSQCEHDLQDDRQQRRLQ